MPDAVLNALPCSSIKILSENVGKVMCIISLMRK